MEKITVANARRVEAGRPGSDVARRWVHARLAKGGYQFSRNQRQTPVSAIVQVIGSRPHGGTNVPK